MAVEFLRAWADGTWDTEKVDWPPDVPYEYLTAWYSETLEKYPHRQDESGIVLVAVYNLQADEEDEDKEE